MATISKVLARVASTTTAGTVLYSVPAGTTTIVTNIAVTNTLAGANQFTFAIGPVASPLALHTSTAIAANTTVYIDLKQVLNATNVITGNSVGGTGLVFHISGVEVS